MNAQKNCYSQTELGLVLGDLGVTALRRVLGDTLPADFRFSVTVGENDVWISYLWNGDETFCYQPEVRAANFAELLGKWRNISWTYERWRARFSGVTRVAS